MKAQVFAQQVQQIGKNAIGWRVLQQTSISRRISVFAAGSGLNQFYFVRDIATMLSVLNKVVFNLRSDDNRADLGVDLATQGKNAGNTYFNQGDFVMAIHEYSLAIEFVRSFSNPLRCILLSNRAQARLNLQQARLALDDANAALALDKSHMKSIERRKSALEMLARNVPPLPECRTKGNVWILSQIPRWLGPNLRAAVSTDCKDFENIDTKPTSSKIGLSAPSVLMQSATKPSFHVGIHSASRVACP
jgi:tetratricopeptide (TPR) repeat protein